MTDSTPRIERDAGVQGASVVLRGSWSAARLGEGATCRRLLHALNAVPGASGWDLRQLEWMDHVGAQLLWNCWGQQWPQNVLASDEQRRLLQRVAAFTARQPARTRRPGMATMLDALGGAVERMLIHFYTFTVLIGQLFLGLLRMLRDLRRAPWRDISGQIHAAGATALPITAMVGFLIGVVLAYLMSGQLRNFGAGVFIIDIMGVSMVRELGPLLAAILVAGRSGSAITAQIGLMRVTEEIDAMRVMGIPIGLRLVLPRALALGIVMPLISVWTTLAGLLGGVLVGDFSLGITPAFFMQSLPSAVSISSLVFATGKSVVFGVLIALIGCHWGLLVKPNTESLGRGTTASVVSSITMVILVDALFAVLFRNIPL